MIRRAGRLDPAAMARALEALIRRHEALRMHFSAAGGDFVQTVGPVPVIGVPVMNLGETPAAEREAGAVRIAAAAARKPFDLENGPLLRAILLQMAEDDF